MTALPVVRHEQRTRAAVSRLGAVLDLWWYEALLSTRLPLGLRSFRRLALLLGAVGLLVSASLLAAVLLVARGAVDDDARYSSDVVSVVTLLAVANLCTGWGREVLTQRRTVVSRAPNAPLFRALDVCARDVLLVYRILPILAGGVRTVVLLSVGLAAAHVANPLRPGTWALPLLVVASTVTLGAALAARHGLSRSGRPRGQAYAAGGALVAGFGLGFWAGGLVASWAGVARAEVPTLSPAASTVAAVVVAAFAAVTTVIAVRGARALVDRSFPLDGAREARGVREKKTGRARTRPVTVDFLVALAQHLRGTWQWTAVSRALISAVLVVSVVGGLRAAGVDPAVLWPPDLIVAVRPAGLYLSVVLAVSLVDIVISVVGPSRMSDHLRTAWELGAPVGSLAASVLLVAILPGVAAGAVLASAMSLLGLGNAVGCFVVATSVAAGTVIADALLPPPRTADGAGAMPAANTLVALLLALPVLAAAAAGGVYVAVASILNVLLVMGAFLCARNRITAHPSSSKVSQPGTGAEHLSSTGSTSSSTDRPSSA